MKYLLLMYADESIGSKWSKEELQAAAKTWAEFRKEMSVSGVLISSSGVAPNTSATTVRVRNDKTMITDGPFAETHEQLGGYFLVECNDLDEAIRWAEKIPTAKYGSIEIRPLWSPGS
ncbi:MAG: YciI family protein [Chloroflexi bacterium]|nr:YciI family protein [Chloroflexota bacterium]MCI0580219.1 YciI family protein [Chloroflexota bacterium]MCI0646930.1 YciI family protein [Chloroflexota bacterium]MCI0728685.1 YciI family protein [Chloroflexota bacterium]